MPTVPSIPDLLAARAERTPTRVAIEMVESAQALTFLQWRRRSDRVAANLAADGVAPGDRVALLFRSPDWIEFAVAYCGVQSCGAVVVPVPEHASTAEVDHILDACGSVRTVGMHDGRHQAFADLEREPTAPMTEVTVEPDQLGLILYTSGTTGKPKGVAASHRNLTYGCEVSPRRRAFEHSEYFLHAYPIGTTAAQAMLVNTLTVHPAALVLGRFDAAAFGSAVEDYGVGTAFVVPAMVIELLDTGAFDKYDFSSLEVMSSTGSTLPPAIAQELVRRLPHATVFNTYSSTEALPAQVTMIVDATRADSLGLPVGLPDGTPGVAIRAADGADLPAGEVGDVWLRCPTAHRTYFADPTATAATFRDGWVRMGDVGRLDADGYLHLEDRATDVIQTGGLRVSTTEIENALLEHPAVHSVAVLGVPHPVMGVVVGAAVVLRSPVGRAELRAFLRDRLARHKVPLRWLFPADLPKNAMGKVVKKELAAGFAVDAAP